MGFVSQRSTYLDSRVPSDVALADGGGKLTPGFIHAGDALFFTGSGLAPLMRGTDSEEFRGVARHDWPSPSGPKIGYFREGIVLFKCEPGHPFSLDAPVYIVDGDPQKVSTEPNGIAIGRVALDQERATPKSAGTLRTTVAVVLTPVF